MRCRVTTAPNGSVTRVSVQAWTGKNGDSTVWIGGKDGRRFVGLLFIGGRLGFYGDCGQKCRVDYKTKVSAAKPKRRDVMAARLDEMCGTASYLRLRGVPMPATTAHPDAPRALPATIPHKKAAAREWLERLCEGHRVTVCPPGLASMWRKDRLGLECGYGRLGGRLSQSHGRNIRRPYRS